MEEKCYYYHSLIGVLRLEADEKGICGLHFCKEELNENEQSSEYPLLLEATKQLDEYFSGKRTSFTVPLSLHGTEFQKKVWRELLNIPYGETCSYGEVARRIGSPKASRAVGMANHKNPIAIFVPCHRVIGSDGTLTGYAGGLNVKQSLLTLEQTSVK